MQFQGLIKSCAVGLRWPMGFYGRTDADCIDWLRVNFGFKRTNVQNQRERLAMLIAEAHTSLYPEQSFFIQLKKDAVDAVLNRLLKFYEGWCDRMSKACYFGQPKERLKLKRKILFISLYLLVLGEASNVRFMPDCVCYIFHKLACQIPELSSKEQTESVPVWSDDAFVRKVIEPLHRVIEEEARKGEKGEPWRDYDDLNEYFRSSDCFSLGWPMRRHSDFFQEAVQKTKNSGRRSESAGKSNSEVKRSFWRVLASFDRSLTFHILALQVMVIAAWIGVSWPREIFRQESLHHISTIFITTAFLRFLHSIVDFCRNFPGWKFSGIPGTLLKIVLSLGNFMVPSLFYLLSIPSASTKLRETLPSLSHVEGASLYVLAIGICSLPDIISAVLFCFPAMRRSMEDSDQHIFRFLLGCSKRRMYAGRTLHESQFMLRRYVPWKIYSMHKSPHTIVRYCMFWAMLLVFRIAFSYYVQIKPLVLETREMMSLSSMTNQWGDIFGMVILLWQPAILAYYYWQVHFMDTQIWFSIFLAACDRFRNLVGERGLREVTAHLKFVEDYLMFSQSHVKALELMMLLVLTNIFGSAAMGSTSPMILEVSMWSLVATTLLGPFLLNPLGFEVHKVGGDWDEWWRWIDLPGSELVKVTKSWESWWDREQNLREFTGFEARIRETFLSLRFFLYQYWIVHWKNPGGSNTIVPFCLSWFFLIGAIFNLKINRPDKATLSPRLRLMIGLFLGSSFLAAAVFFCPGFRFGAIFSCVLASVPAGWGLLRVMQACSPVAERLGLWDFVKETARAYDRMMGFALLAPLTLVARLPLVSRWQAGCYFFAHWI